MVLTGYLLGDSLSGAEQVLAHLPLVGVTTVVLMIASMGARRWRTRRGTSAEPVPVTTTGGLGSGKRWILFT